MGKRLLLKCTVTTAALFALSVPAALANVGGFEGGDGTQVLGNCSSAASLDWQCLSPSQYIATVDPAGSSDVQFGGGEKEDSPDQWTFAPGSPAAKADALGAWSYSFTNAAHDTNYLALAFDRGGTGDSFFGFELNQSSSTMTNSAGTSIVCPANGDVVVSFEIPGSGPVALHVYKWAWTSGTPCTTGAAGSFTALSLPAGSAELAINSSAITNTLSAATLGNTFQPGTFGEAAVNLTAIANAVAPAAGCEFFNHLQVTSRSSSSITSQLEDFVDGGQVAARACESPTGGGGGGGGGGIALPNVAITSPADNSLDTTSTVVLTGTSDQPEVEVLDGNTVDGNAPVTSGQWTLTLTQVADGLHTYSAVATNSAGTTTSNIVHVTVKTPSGTSGGGASGGTGSTAGGTATSSSSTPPAGAGAAASRPAAKSKKKGKHKGRQLAICSSKRKFIIRIRTRHSHLVSATITVNGKVIKTLRGRRITAPVDLRGLPRGRFVIHIRAVAANGRVFTGKRVYHTCVSRGARRTIPLL